MPKWRILFSVFILSSLFMTEAQAKDVSVFDVRRPLAMDNSEAPPKDYYINAGTESGLKSGMTVKVFRRNSLYDPYTNKSPGDLVVLVGQLRLIHVQGDMSVARLENIEGREKLPTLDFDAIMLGDRVDLSTAKMQ